MQSNILKCYSFGEVEYEDSDYLTTFVFQFLAMGFHINKKVADKKATAGTKATFQGGSSKFIAKASTKSSGTTKKPIKTGGSRGS